jgi:hypothetical protein
MFRKTQDEQTKKKITFLDEKISSLHDELNELGNIRFAFVAFYVLTLCFILFIIILTFIRRALYPTQFWIYVICFPFYVLMGTVSLKSINKLYRKTKESYNIAKKERDAEKIVQDYLRKNLTEDYKLFENISTGFGDIDAIVVGPTGIFLIEIKSNSGVIASNEEHKLLIIDGDTPHKNYREQVIKELTQLKKYLDNNTSLNCWINPVLVFPFGTVIKEVKLTSEFDKFSIPVLDLKNLLKYIYSNTQSQRLSKEEIEIISKAIEE